MSKITIHPSSSTCEERSRPMFMAMIVKDDGKTEGLPSTKPVQWSVKFLERRSGETVEDKFRPLTGEEFEPVEENRSVIRIDITKLEGLRFQLKATLEDAESDPVDVSGTNLPEPLKATQESRSPAAPCSGPRGAIGPEPARGFSGGAGPKHHHLYHHHHVDNEAGSTLRVGLARAESRLTDDEPLWIAIRNSTDQLGYKAYEEFVGTVLPNSMPDLRAEYRDDLKHVAQTQKVTKDELSWMVSSFGQYPVLRKATEVFVMTRCAVLPTDGWYSQHRPDEEARFGHDLPAIFSDMWKTYAPLPPTAPAEERILPYLDIIRRKLGEMACRNVQGCKLVDEQMELLHRKLVYPCMLELIWSYWHEEGMLVQTMNAIAQRFQNVRAPGSDRDPLAQLEIDPLRGLNQLIWGYVQDETNHLSVMRRAHEYDHHYGFTLHGKAVADLRTADRRSKFLESFHNLLSACYRFYREDDHTTVIGDAFPVLNAVKETHYLLSHGAHNQFGDLPATARQEMLMQQYLLSRPEMREFLGGRIMVPYPETWMDRVDVVKKLKGWTDTSVVHFRDLGTFGEQIVLSIRYGSWSTINDPRNAANWARYWRAEIQAYIHAYRAVTGVDLTADTIDERRSADRFLPPSVHLRNRLNAQAGK